MSEMDRWYGVGLVNVSQFVGKQFWKTHPPKPVLCAVKGCNEPSAWITRLGGKADGKVVHLCFSHGEAHGKKFEFEDKKPSEEEFKRAENAKVKKK